MGYLGSDLRLAATCWMQEMFQAENKDPKDISDFKDTQDTAAREGISVLVVPAVP
jgi:hypothetical protein